MTMLYRFFGFVLVLGTAVSCKTTKIESDLKVAPAVVESVNGELLVKAGRVANLPDKEFTRTVLTDLQQSLARIDGKLEIIIADEYPNGPKYSLEDIKKTRIQIGNVDYLLSSLAQKKSITPRDKVQLRSLGSSLLLSATWQQVGSTNPCSNQPDTERCSECVYPGNKTCTLINCKGQPVGQSTNASCNLDQAQFSCGACELFSHCSVPDGRGGCYSGGWTAYRYSVRYNGRDVEVIGADGNMMGLTECERQRSGDSRCPNR